MKKAKENSAIQLIQEQIAALKAAYLAFYHLPSSLSTSSSVLSFSILLFHAWDALKKKHKRTVRSAYSISCTLHSY